MDAPSPITDRSELQPLRWLAGCMLAGVAFVTALLLSEEFIPLCFGALGVLGLACLFPAVATRIPRWFHVAMFPFSVAVFAADFALTRELVPALVRLNMLLLLYRACTPRKRRDDLQLLLLGLFLIVITGVLTTSLSFGILLVVFVGCGMGLLTIRTLTDTASGADSDGAEKLRTLRSPAAWLRELAFWRKRISRSTVIILGILTLAMLPIAAFLFLVIPRFELRQSLFFERLFSRGSSTGFTETVRFGEVSQIQQDRRVAFRFDATERPETQLYWRMLVLDEYVNRSFRSSTALQAVEFGAVQTVTRLAEARQTERSAPLSGAMYFEPGISRYLPLTGPYRALDFSETQMLRRSGSLGLIRLDREPATLKAWRITDMDTAPALTHPAMVGARDATALQRFMQIPFVGEERQKLDALVETIRRDTDGSRAGFVRAASRWLRSRHGYSLQMELPNGQGDPLLRWIDSSQPGHCELFAGSLVMLCRSAGIPARMIAGFAGGEWNEDYLIVRNSDAHAWVEFLDGKAWQRADPTIEEPGEVRAASNALPPGVRELESGWEARFDRLRVLWYRRVVNFDQRDQQELIGATGDTVRGGMQASFKKIGAAARGLWKELPSGTEAPIIIGLGLGGACLVWGLIRIWGSRRHSAKQRLLVINRQRAVATKWIQTLLALPESPERAELLRDLRLVRYGPESHWPELSDLWRRSRAIERELRRRAKTSAGT